MKFIPQTYSAEDIEGGRNQLWMDWSLALEMRDQDVSLAEWILYAWTDDMIVTWYEAQDEQMCRANLEYYEKQSAIFRKRFSEACPHGIVGDCNACNIAGDLAYDAAREDHVFGRR